MKVSYAVDSEKFIQIYRYFFKNTRSGAECIQTRKFILFSLVCFGILFPVAIISTDSGKFPAMRFYVLSMFLLVIFSKQLLIKALLWSQRKKLHEIENETVEIELHDDVISFRGKAGLVQYDWRYVKYLERTEQFLLIKGWHSDQIIPRYAFNTQESFEEFCRQADISFKKSEATDEKQSNKNSKWAHYSPILLGFIIALSLSSGSQSSDDPQYLRDADGFWHEVLRSETIWTNYTFDTTRDFQKMVTEEDWTKHIGVLKERYGRVQSRYPIASVKTDDKPARAVVLHRILGQNESYYIRTYLVEDSPDWEVNGYDIITPVNVDVKEQTFSLESDRALLKSKLPYKIPVTDKSVLELSGYEGD